jgi:uncharacterized membrane protein YkoI
MIMSLGRSGLRIGTAMLAGILYFANIAPVTAEDDHVTARKLRESGQILPLEQILERARARQPGQVLETELERKHDVYVYEVEILDADGWVWELKFDARTGELIELERND